MILISLDEGGTFEQVSANQNNLIGGLVFQCVSKADIEQEGESLANFFRQICSEQQCQYPYDLHYNWKNGAVINADNAKKVKDALAAELPDYLQKQGRWTENRPASGNYSVFCMVGDQKGLDDRTKSNLKDTFATIRYEHMIYRTIENLILYSPRFQGEKEYTLHLPTRVINLNNKKLQDRKAIEKELISLGYRIKIDKNGNSDGNIYEVTDATGFRVCLESVSMNSCRDDLHFDLMVNSIYYEADKKKQRFLYLADTLCSVYQDAINGKRTVAGTLPALMEKCKQMVGTENTLIWAYHPVDIKWRSVWDGYQQGNWFDALRLASEIQSSRDTIEKIYQKIWIHDFEEILTDRNKLDLRGIRAMENALTRLDDYLQDMQKRQQSTALYIIGQLKRCREGIGDPVRGGKLDYLLAKILTALYNHQGKYNKAEEEYKKCIEAARFVPIEDYLGIQLLHIVSLCDAEKYTKAEALAKEILSHHGLLNEIKNGIYPKNKLIPDSYGRALSQHGQTLTLLGRYDEAINEFDQALKIFEEAEKDQKKHSRDWQMTCSFLLHTLIDKGDKRAYEEKAIEFFGASSVKIQYNAIVEKKCGNPFFAYYIFLKGLWVFGGKETDPELIRSIVNAIESEMKSVKPEHPMEQIMKYCAFLWYRYFETKGHHPRTDELMELGKTVLAEAEGVLKVIKSENEKQYQNVIDGNDYMKDGLLHFTYC